MNTKNFEQLIRIVTGRDFVIKTEDVDIEFEKEYYIFKILPVTGRTVGFKWKAPKSDDKMLRSFITAFCSKYTEPDPAAYNKVYGGKEYRWDDKTPEQKEFAYLNHRSNMFSKDELLKQVEANFANPSIAAGIRRYGFYPTNYGIGIFCFWMTDGVNNAITQMKTHLQKIGLPFENEFSDARWVLRFKLNLSKDLHTNLLTEFANA